MSRKIPLGIAIAAAFIAAAFSVAVTVSVCTGSYNRLIRDLPQRTQQYAVLSEIDEVIRDHYYGETDREAILSNMAAGYVQGLNDGQCFFVPQENLAAYQNTVAGNMPGVGVTAVYDAAAAALVIRDVAVGSPAAQAGLSVGDRIYAVDGAAVTAQNASSLIDRLLNASQKTTSVSYSRAAAGGGETPRESVSLKNGYVAQSCVAKTVGSVGYLYLYDFYPDTAERFDEAVRSFTDAGISSLILDVRNTDSVNYEYACKVIDRIVPLAADGTGAIATAKNAAGETVKIYPSDSAALNLSIAVLINDRTAGAAELLACDLRDFGKAKLFGEKTAGEGMLPELYPLDSGGAVMLAAAKIYPYVSDPYDGEGVAPDVAVPMVDTEKSRIPADTFDGDPQFAAAYEFFNAGK